MMPFKKCPVCGGEMVEKEVEKLLRGGVNIAAVTARAEVCLHCGERLYSADTVSRFQQIRAKLSCHEVADLKPMGQSFQTAV
ncbi:MAG: YgiT-type zinc finger protein [Caldilineaceae bacterium SB0670_bin_27]|uniref:YgiT-type zinc finger protein n=1 Tax=Caldilineaceae bacterium SB0664_bin_27 TaxID=2605260 RepID=A0A6B0YQV7_9CHLR|nr:YgiT-type zinc finger protein [Caldilineaceae bacterium SB0664_bin_27]MYJ77222.1 YgiT-type zinc finger protein [Caldilineaceae bacterium SB0670_bin_27]